MKNKEPLGSCKPRIFRRLEARIEQMASQREIATPNEIGFAMTREGIASALRSRIKYDMTRKEWRSEQ